MRCAGHHGLERSGYAGDPASARGPVGCRTGYEPRIRRFGRVGSCDPAHCDRSDYPCGLCVFPCDERGGARLHRADVLCGDCANRTGVFRRPFLAARQCAGRNGGIDFGHHHVDLYARAAEPCRPGVGRSRPAFNQRAVRSGISETDRLVRLGALPDYPWRTLESGRECARLYRLFAAPPRDAHRTASGDDVRSTRACADCAKSKTLAEFADTRRA